MPNDIKFNCAGCGTHIVIDEAGAGMSVPCPTCGASLIVPPVESPAVADENIQVKEDGSYSVCAPPARLPNLDQQVEYKIEADEGEFVKIEQFDFYGQFSRSPNGRFMLTWKESWNHPFTGKHSLGLYFLLDGNRAIVTGRMERPNDGKVSNSGNFILNDWMEYVDYGEKLRGTFYAFAATGEILVSKGFKANLSSNGISEDGRFAFCDTCESDYEAHAVKVFIFDLETKTLLSTFDGPASERFQFDVENRIISFIEYDATERRYTFEGDFLDDEALTGGRLATYINRLEKDLQKQQDNYERSVLHEQLMDLYQKSDAPIKAEEHRAALIQLTEQSVQQKWLSEFQRSLMHRKLADLYQAAGNELKAIEHHDAWLQSADGRQVFMFAESQAKKLTGTNIATYTEAIAFMERALERGDTESYRPKIHRTLGEIYLRCGDKTKAIEHLETALQLDPSIGVKKLLKPLKTEKQN
jgi:tetratricopeptide (TPR) repeat protein